MIFDHSPTGRAVFKIRQNGWRMPFCEAPVHRELHESILDVHPSIRPAGSADIFVPCRKCAKCRYIRRKDWELRIGREQKKHDRCWFVTLTYRALGPSGRGNYADVQRYLKRVRKVCPRFRFCCVAETGDAKGRWHWHLLIFGPSSLTKLNLRRKWPLGFTHARLATDGAAEYVAHYSAKALLRVHASLRFGAPAVVYARAELPSCIPSGIQNTFQVENTTESPFSHGAAPLSAIYKGAWLRDP